MRCRELIALPPTPKNLQYASRLREKILFEIGTDVFDYRQTFPDSPMLQKLGLGSEVQTVRELLLKWLKGKEKHIEKSSLKGYISAIEYRLIPELGDYLYQDLTLGMVKEWRDSMIGEVSNKTINNVMIPLRQALQYAVEHSWIPHNPLNGLRNLGKTNPEEVDPFTFDEVKQLLNIAEDGYERNLWQFTFFTGLRCGELMPLRWANVDLAKKVIYIKDNLVLGELKAPKTNLSRRTIQLIAPALEALTAQYELTGQGEFVWLNPRNGQAITTHKQLTGMWQRLVARSSLPYKNLYATRHTFASLMLSAGEPPMWVAAQMGHANLAMLQKHYGRWLTNQQITPGQKAVTLYQV